MELQNRNGSSLCLLPFALAFLLFPAGATILDTINAMPDNTWLRLPANGAQPITRSGSNRMHYDGDSVGYLWGTCHAGFHNDLWTFNVSANRWRENQATEPSVYTDPLVIKNQDSILQTRDGRPLSFHQWSTMDFDTDHKKLWRCSYGGWQGLYSGHDSVVCQYQPGPTCNVHTKNRVMGSYDPVANQWTPVKFQPYIWPLTCSTCGEQYGVFEYIPYLKKFVYIVWGYYSDKFVLIDPVNATLQTLNLTLQPMAGESGHTKVSQLGGAVWDSYREKMIFVGSTGTGTWAFDPKTMTMKQIVSIAGSPAVWTDCNTSHMVYDAGNRCALIYTTPGMQTCYGGGTWPNRSAVYVLDFEGGKWDLLPPPPSGQSPTSASASSTHGYFDQRMGVIFHYEGSYCATGGVGWIYKYKTAPGTAAERQGQTANGTPRPGSGQEGQITVWPNPARKAVRCQLPDLRAEKVAWKIYNTAGRLVRKVDSGDRTVVMETSGLPAGVYAVEAKAGTLVMSKKFLVAH